MGASPLGERVRADGPAGSSYDSSASATIIAIAQDRMLDQLEEALGGYERIARHAVSAEGAAMIVAEAEES